MATPPVFSAGAVLTAAQMNAVGLWLVKTQAGPSGATSFTISDAFSADYDSYKIIYSGGHAAADCDLELQLGSSTTGYYGTLIYGTHGGTGPTLAANNNGTAFFWLGGGNTTSAILTCELHNPYLTEYTYCTSQTYGGNTANGATSHVHKVATSYTAFTIKAGQALTGGTVRVYGYRT